MWGGGKDRDKFKVLLIAKGSTIGSFFLGWVTFGVYVSNVMVIYAPSSRGMVVYRELFGSGSQVCYGRPHVR